MIAYGTPQPTGIVQSGESRTIETELPPTPHREAKGWVSAVDLAARYRTRDSADAPAVPVAPSTAQAVGSCASPFYQIQQEFGRPRSTNLHIRQ